jgi:Rrf2 family protein
MRADSRLPRVLHVLLHLDEIDEPITSEQIGTMLGMNPSLVRRTMGGLRKAGFVGSTKGHGGGWFLEKSLSEISMVDVYEALGKPKLFALGAPDETSTCLLEKAANAATKDALQAAQKEFINSLRMVTISDLADESREKIRQHQKENSY